MKALLVISVSGLTVGFAMVIFESQSAWHRAAGAALWLAFCVIAVLAYRAKKR